MGLQWAIALPGWKRTCLVAVALDLPEWDSRKPMVAQGRLVVEAKSWRQVDDEAVHELSNMLET